MIKVLCLKLKKIIKPHLNTIRNIIDCLVLPFSLIQEYNKKRKWLSKIEIANYRKNIKIYDIFMFFNEIETLEIRLNILDKYVDYFVIVESTETFTGLPKKLYYEENKNLFKKWENKIIHYVIRDTPVDENDLRNRLLKKNISTLDEEIINNTLSSKDIPKGQIQWLKEFYQKENIKKILTNFSDDDFCYISDLDEIWNPEILIDYSKDGIFKYKQDCYIYYFNNRSNENWRGWSGTIATKYKNIKRYCLNDLRNRSEKIFKNDCLIIRNSGWHFTFQGGINQIKMKLESYGHQEINTEKIKSNLDVILKNSKDIRGRHIRFWKDENKLPKYLLENKEKYKKFFR